MLGVHRLTVANYESGASPTPLSSAVRLLRFYDAKLDLRPLEATLAALDEQHLADTLYHQLRDDLAARPQGATLDELAAGRDASAVALALAALVARGELGVRGRGNRRVYTIAATSP